MEFKVKQNDIYTGMTSIVYLNNPFGAFLSMGDLLFKNAFDDIAENILKEIYEKKI